MMKKMWLVATGGDIAGVPNEKLGQVTLPAQEIHMYEPNARAVRFPATSTPSSSRSAV